MGFGAYRLNHICHFCLHTSDTISSPFLFSIGLLSNVLQTVRQEADRELSLNNRTFD